MWLQLFFLIVGITGMPYEHSWTGRELEVEWTTWSCLAKTSDPINTPVQHDVNRMQTCTKNVDFYVTMHQFLKRPHYY